MLSKFLVQIQHLDHLIQIKGTGTPEDLAARMNISRRTLYDLIKTMKEKGAPIKYDNKRQSFFYTEPGNFLVTFSATDNPSDMQFKTEGNSTPTKPQ